MRKRSGPGNANSRFDIFDEFAKQKPDIKDNGILTFDLSDKNEKLFEERRKESLGYLERMIKG